MRSGESRSRPAQPARPPSPARPSLPDPSLPPGTAHSAPRARPNPIRAPSEGLGTHPPCPQPTYSPAPQTLDAAQDRAEKHTQGAIHRTAGGGEEKRREEKRTEGLRPSTRTPESHTTRPHSWQRRKRRAQLSARAHREERGRSPPHSPALGASGSPAAESAADAPGLQRATARSPTLTQRAQPEHPAAARDLVELVVIASSSSTQTENPSSRHRLPVDTLA